MKKLKRTTEFDMQQDVLLDNFRSLHKDAQIYRVTGHFAEAITLYEQAVKVMQTFGDSWVEQKKSAGHWMYFRKCGFAEQQIALTRLDIANCYYNNRKFVTAFEHYCNLNLYYIAEGDISEQKIRCGKEIKRLAWKKLEALFLGKQTPTKNNQQNQTRWDEINYETIDKAVGLIMETMEAQDKMALLIKELIECQDIFIENEDCLNTNAKSFSRDVAECLHILQTQNKTRYRSRL